MAASGTRPEAPLPVARRLLPTALAAWLAAAGAAAGGGEIRLPAPGSGDWQELEFRSIRRTTRYTPVSVGGTDAVRAESDCSASALLLPLRDVDPRRTPVLAWRWRLERALDVPDERVPAGDDFAARVYVLFRFEPARATFAERLRHRMGSLFYAQEPPGSAIDFVWASRAPVGASWESPRAADARMVVQATGPPTGWREERADVAAWYERLFGHPPPALLAVALMTDSDDTCRRATALYSDFRFAPRDP